MRDVASIQGSRTLARLEHGDEWRAFPRFSEAVWYTVALGALAVLPARGALQPGSTELILLSAAYAAAAGLITRWAPRRALLAVDLVLRAIGIWVLHQNVAHNLEPAYWLLCLPMFISGIMIPALFYRAAPLTAVTAAVAIATGRLAAGAEAPSTVRAISWVSFVWIMGLIVVVIQRLATERRRALAAMTALASTDALTGLPNRRHFMTAAARLLATAHDEGRPCTLMLFDVDHFKSVNDVYGHDAGDRVLGGIAAAMRSTCRSDDLIARLGGEEFVILMLGASALHAQYIASELASRLRDIEPVAVTASFGVVEAKVGELEIGDLLVRADVALYQAKRTGRNRCVVES